MRLASKEGKGFFLMPHVSEHAARKKIPFPLLKRIGYLFRIEPAFVDDRDEEELGDTGKGESGDDGSTETLPDRIGEGDRDESDNRCEGREEYWFKATGCSGSNSFI